MSNTLSVLKKGVSIAVTTSTIVWSVGIGALAPLATHAAQPGQLIKKAGLSTVYYLGSDLKRYVFPTAAVYFSWYQDFSGVVTVSDSELSSYPLSGRNITMRPGTKLVKIGTIADTYAVEPGGLLRKIANESIATTLYGPNVWSRVQVVADESFGDYKQGQVGTPISTNVYPSGALIKSATSSDIFYVDGSTKRKLTAQGLTDNKINVSNAVVAPDSIFNALSTGSDVTGQDSMVWGIQSNVSVVVGGDLTVALSTDTPPFGALATGQALADLAHFTFTGSGTLGSVQLKRLGVSDSDTLSNVYLFDGNTRLTDGYQFNSDGQLTINNINAAIAGSKTIAVKGDVFADGNNSGQTIGVQLTGYAASGATLAPVAISGSLFSVINGTGVLASAAFTALSSSSVATGTVNAGTTQNRFWSAPLQISTRQVQLRGANFRMTGSAPSDALKNIKLFVDGLDTGKTGTVVSLSGTNYVVFDLMTAPYTLNTGTHTIEVRADVDKGSARSVIMSVQQSADLVLFDTQSNVNIAILDDAFLPNASGTITINAGSLTITADPAFQALTNITGGASSVPIFRGKIRAYGEDVKVDSFLVLPVIGGTTPAADGLNDVEIFLNGSQVGSTQDWTSGNLSFNPGSQMIVPSGIDSVLEIRADVQTNDSVNYTAGTISANVVAVTGGATGQFSKEATNVPAFTGNTLTIQTSTLAVSKNTGYATQTLSPNTSGAKIGSFVLQNQSTSESTRVTTLSVNIAYGAGAGSTNLSSLRTSETSGAGATPVQPATAALSSNATNTFSVDLVLAPGATKTIDIFADTGSTAGGTVTVTTTLTVSSIGVTSNVSATSAAIGGQVITLNVGAVTNPPTVVVSASTESQYIAAAGGATNAATVVYNFKSTSSDSIITELTFDVVGLNTITSVKVGNVTAPVVGTQAYLTGLSLPVPNGGSGLSQSVLISYSDVGTSGIASGTTSKLELQVIKYSSGGTTATITNPTVTSEPTMTLVGSKPVVTLVDSSNQLVTGSVKIGSVTVVADAKGSVSVDTINITINSTNTPTIASATNNVIVKNASTNSTIASTNDNLTVAAGGSDTTTITLTGGYEVSAGGSVTFDIYVPAATVTGASGDSSLSMSLTTPATGFTWSDLAGGGTAGSSARTGVLIFNFPTNTSVITN